jgi:glucokinase
MPPEGVLAIDLGGTKMRAAIVDADGSVSRRRERPTPQRDRDLDVLLELAKEVLGGDVFNAVVAVPGRVDYRLGRLEYAPNLPPPWTEMLSGNYLTEKLGIEVVLANDADAAAVGEAYFGAGRHHDDVAYMTVSTGIGAGILLGGRLVRGRRSSTEVGHTVIDRRAFASDGPATLEELGSGSTLETLAASAGLAGGGRHVTGLVRSGHPAAMRLWRELVEVVAIGACNLTHLYTPEIIVLGGGVGLNRDLLIEPIKRQLTRHGPRFLPEPIEVVTSELKDDAGLVGAAAWGRATRLRDRDEETSEAMDRSAAETPRRLEIA